MDFKEVTFSKLRKCPLSPINDKKKKNNKQTKKPLILSKCTEIHII